MERKTKINVLLLVTIALMILIIPVTINLVYQQREIEIPIKIEIEKGVEVRNIENKFETAMSLGGAGGLGAPEVKCKNAKQFIELVEPEETIYIDFKEIDCQLGPGMLYSTGECLEKTYWSFIENRAGIISYTDRYVYAEHPDSLWLGRLFYVKNYTSDSVVFVKGNGLTVFLLILCFEAIIFLLSAGIYSKINKD